MSRFVMERVDSGFENLSGAGRLSGRLERSRAFRSPARARVMSAANRTSRRSSG